MARPYLGYLGNVMCAIALRLCGNLQVDIRKTKQLLGWTPPVSVDEALRQTAHAYLQNHR